MNFLTNGSSCNFQWLLFSRKLNLYVFLRLMKCCMWSAHLYGTLKKILKRCSEEQSSFEIGSKKSNFFCPVTPLSNRRWSNSMASPTKQEGRKSSTREELLPCCTDTELSVLLIVVWNEGRPTTSAQGGIRWEPRPEGWTTIQTGSTCRESNYKHSETYTESTKV